MLSNFERYFGKTKQDHDLRIEKENIAAFTEDEAIGQRWQYKSGAKKMFEQSPMYMKKLHRMRQSNKRSFFYFNVAGSGIGIGKFVSRKGRKAYAIIAPRIRDKYV